VISFKQFLTEGGKATEKHGTVRATQADMQAALKFVSNAIEVPVSKLAKQLLGSARLTHAGHQLDSGDVDIALPLELKTTAVEKLTAAVGSKPLAIGGSTFSFAVPAGDKKVQVDLMFVTDLDWASFSHYSSKDSAHKSAVRNELLHSALKFSAEDGKDLRVKDAGGEDIVRASRAYKLDTGVERIFKVAKNRKDGKGRVKGTSAVSPLEVQAALDALGHSGKFSSEQDLITDPDKFAALLFGNTVTAADLKSAEQLIKLIAAHSSAKEIFKDAVKGMIRRKLVVPPELEEYR